MSAALDEPDRLRRRAERERRARFAAENIAERATSKLYDALAELTEAELRARIVTETAARVFGSALDLGARMAAITASALEALRASRATCYVLSGDGRVVRDVHTTETDPGLRAQVAAAAGRPALELPPWRVLRRFPEPILILDHGGARTSAQPLGVHDAPGLVALRLENASAPAAGGARALGMLLVGFALPRVLSGGERLAARSLAAMAGVALVHARMHAQTLESLALAEERAALDPLTGLANHRTFQERLLHEVARARNHNRSLSLAVIDLDHFKRVNDTYGHQVGDQVLRSVAEILRSLSRASELVARVGGEEFAWLMPETDAMDAWAAAERVRTAISEARVPTVGRVSVSAGVCDLAQASSAAELYRLADGALYRAKQHGRDVVFRYSSDVVGALSSEEYALRLRREQALQSIRLLARAVDAKDPSTQRHSERVADLAVALATALGWPMEQAARLREAGLVHDIGKIGVPDAILGKVEPLTDEEYATIKTHAALGAEMVKDVLDADQVTWVRGHHERVDGRGYPDGLAGDEIPEGARVLAVADAWDAMTSARPYRRPLTRQAALATCRRVRGAQLDHRAVEALEAICAAGALPSTDAPKTHRLRTG